MRYRRGADQRYYASSYGRFNTADPYQASAGPSDPGSWNRYSYVGGDPVNNHDWQGLAIDLNCIDFSAWNQSGNCGGDGFIDSPSASINPGCSNVYSGANGYVTGVGTMNCWGFTGSAVFTVPEIPCSQLLTNTVSSFLSGKDSPLAGYAATIVQVAQADNIDPTLIAAIAIAENGQKTNNPFALGPNGSNTYATLSAAISAVGSQLDKYIYTWSESTVSALWSGKTWVVNPQKP